MSTFSTYIKTISKKFQYNAPSAGNHTVDVFTASDYSYIDVEYIKVIGNSSAVYRVIDITSGITLHTVAAANAGGGINVTLNRMAETTQDFTQANGNGIAAVKSLRIPNGCKLQASFNTVAAATNSVVAVGIEFANTQ